MKQVRFKKILFSAITLFISVVAMYGIYGDQAFTRFSTATPPKPVSYEKEWKTVDSLAAKGLTKSALEAVARIYIKAKATNNSTQLVKTILYRMKFEQLMEESSEIKAIAELHEELKQANFPLKPILHSILAENYWMYYQVHRWEFNKRTHMQTMDAGDLTTWDLTTIFKQVTKNYQLSLEKPEQLQQSMLENYDEILLIQKKSRHLRPTLYDFLAHRAIDFYKNEESGLLKPVRTFEMDNPAYFLDADQFSKLSITTKDSFSSNYYALRLFQDLIRFHTNGTTDKSMAALVDVDLERLKFVNDKSTLDEKDSLYLFSLQNLEKKAAADPASAEVTYEIAQLLSDKGNEYVPLLSTDKKWFKKQALELCDAAIKKYPKSDGAKNCLALKAQINAHSMELTTDKITSPQQASLGLLKYKNVKKIFFRIVQLNSNDSKNEALKVYGEQAVNYYLKFPVVKEWTLDLPNDGDHQMHATEIKLPALPQGSYVLLSASGSNFSFKNNGVAYSALSVSGISYVARQLPNGSFDMYVMDRETGVPLKGAEAQLYYEKYDYQSRSSEYVLSEKYRTDEQGFFRIQRAKEYRNVRIDFSYNNDVLRADNVIYQYQWDSVPKIKHPKTFFYLDRGIYRPGQTIYFKGIMINSDEETNEILPKTKTTVVLFDANSQKVADLELVTNEYGTINGSFTAPLNVLPGSMSISNESGQAYFSVEDYKRPKFEITFNPLKGSYRLNEQIKITGNAKAFSGSKITDATVTYRVVRNTILPYYSYDAKGFLPPPASETEITNGTTVTSDTGSFVIIFKAVPDKRVSAKRAPTYSYTVFADVTDLNGETHGSETVVTVGYTALNLEIPVPETINNASVKAYPIQLTNMNGEPETAAGKIEIFKLKQPDKIFRKRNWEQPDQHTLSKQEFEKEFPKDEYGDENDRSKWQREMKVFNTTFTGKSDSLKIPDLKTWVPGSYVIEASCKDVFGQDVKLTKYITVYSTSTKEMPVNEVNWFNLITANAVQPGDKAMFVIGTKEKDVQVIYEIEHKGVIVKKERFVLNNEQKIMELPVEEKHRGNVAIHYLFVKNNRSYSRSAIITVPYTNKELDIQFETFRNKLMPGQQEEWKLKIKDKKGDKVAAEMLATLYDASLDQLRPNNWYLEIYQTYYSSLNWDSNSAFNVVNSQLVDKNWNTYPEITYRLYDELNGFNGQNASYVMANRPRGVHQGAGKDQVMSMPAAQAPPMQKEMTKLGYGDSTDNSSAGLPLKKDKQQPSDLTGITARKNFSETAFFYPQLETDQEGSIIIKFTIPEATTKWKMMGLAHTKDLKFGIVNNELVTQKEVMVVPNAPRFFRENDKLVFTSKISNVSDKELSGSAQLFLYDAKTMKEITTLVFPSTTVANVPFHTAAGKSTVVSWPFSVPENTDAIMYKVVAKAGNYTDGEEMTVPVLTNRMLMTETLPLYVNGKQTKKFHFEKFSTQNGGSATLRNYKLTLEFTANPAWYAIQSLPYLMDNAYDCSDQLFARFYANSLATHIANSSPKIKAVFDSWRTAAGDQQNASAALLSNLEKNEELKSVLLEETPWVLEAKNETERKKRVGLLFDLNKMSSELSQVIERLKKQQGTDGSWSWFAGMPPDRYITQHIVTGMGHLDHLQVKNIRQNPLVMEMVTSAIQYLDRCIQRDYEELVKHNKDQLDKNQLGALQVQYLYARSYFKDIPVNEKSKTAVAYYLKQAAKYWLPNTRYLQGMIALTLNRYDEKRTAQEIMKSLKENSITTEEMGMYWKDNYEHYYWQEAPIEAQALLIEAFDEVANDQESVDDLKVWLLRSKQTQNWRTSKATVEAVYALLLKGTDWLSMENTVEIKTGTITLSNDKNKDELTKQEMGTGYFKTSWSGNDVKPSLADITIKKKDAGISWGAMYWQYFEQLDKITPAKTPLQLKKQLFLQKNTAAGFVLDAITENTKLKIGDKLIIRIELRTDRDMEYVHLKDMRASGLEPVNVLSTYKWQDGLGYYESTRDAATNFFFSYFPKGSYVIEYPLMITHEGDFSNGVTTVQCMYAPEFASNSEGTRLTITAK